MHEPEKGGVIFGSIHVEASIWKYLEWQSVGPVFFHFCPTSCTTPSLHALVLSALLLALGECRILLSSGINE